MAVDFGDAPASYRTRLVDDGARHTDIGIRLGALRDTEADGIASLGSTGDDVTSSDDEDGITFLTALTAGQTASIRANVSQNGKIDGWVDFNGNQQFESFEKIFNSVSIVTGNNTLFAFVPPDAHGIASSNITHARFRVSSAGGLGPTGLASNGEVEDYQVIITPSPSIYDFQKASYSTTEFNGGTIARVVRSGDTSGSSIVHVVMSDQTTSSDDFDHAPIPVSFAAGETIKVFFIPCWDDSTVEPHETALLSFSGGTSGTTQPTALFQIFNQDTTQVFISNETHDEGSSGGTTTFQFEVSLSAPVQGGFSIDYTTADGTATLADNDYQYNNGSLTFLGTSSETNFINVDVNHDTTQESNETFLVDLGSIVSFAGVDPAFITIVNTPAIGTILNDETNSAPNGITLSSNRIKERNSIGAIVGLLTANDPDVGDSHDFALVAGMGDTDNASFTIVNDELQIVPSADYEAKPTYSIRLRATDAGGLFTEQQFTIMVEDEPEGTIGNDVFTISSNSSQFSVLLGTTILGTFPFSSPLTFFGLGGSDTLKIVGTNGVDSLTIDVNGVNYLDTLIQQDSVEINSIETRLGSDSIYIESIPLSVLSLTLKGEGDDDTYWMNTDNNLGTLMLDETGGGNDTLDFSGNTLPLSVNLSLATTQIANANLSLNLKSGGTFENVFGGLGNDTLIGNSLPNRLVGNAGNDVLSGAAGNDTYTFNMDGAIGTDTITDSSGIDTLDFSPSTTVAANIDLSLSIQQVVSPNLSLTLPSGTAIENLIGTQQADIIAGNSLANRLEGGGGDDVISGGSGNDIYAFMADGPLGIDTLNDAVGIETLDFSSTLANGVTVDLSQAGLQVVNASLSLILGSATSFDNLTGSADNDILMGNGSANVLIGGQGNDLLQGRSGNDSYPFRTTLNLGSDTIDDSAGTDIVDFSTTTTGSGVTINLGLTTTQVVNPMLSLTITSASSIENLTGSALADSLTGNSLPNTIVGGLGSDLLIGAAGNDTYIFDGDLALGTDTINDVSGIDLINLSSTTTKPVSIDLSNTSVQAVTSSSSLILGSSTSIENVTGGSSGNTLIGNSLSNTFVGGAGNDSFIGGTGDDIYTFDVDIALGQDSIDESAGGLDTLSFSNTTTSGIVVDLSLSSAQAIRSGYLTLTLAGIEKVIGTNLADTITGNAFNNILLGGGGADTIQGGDGRDLLIGGLGADIISGGSEEDLILAGTSSYDANAGALFQILGEWTSGSSYSTRVSNLRTGTGGIPSLVKTTTVKKDSAANSLSGNSSDDWFFADLIGGADTLFDLALSELVDEL